MGWRHYDPYLGRFIKPDKIIPNAGNSADFDRYAYVRSNPLRFIDPSGNKPCEFVCEGDYIDQDEAQFGAAWYGEWDIGQQWENQEKAAFALFIFEVIASVVFEPIDWVLTGLHCMDGECGPEILLGLLPIIPGRLGSAGRKLDDLIPYQVGPYDELKKLSKPGDILDLHHAPQTHPANQVIPDYNHSNAPTIALPHDLHVDMNPTNIIGPYSGTPRDLMAKTIRDLRNYTDVSNRALHELLDLAKSTYTGVFGK